MTTPQRLPAPLQIPVADLVSGDARLYFDGTTVTCIRGPAGGKVPQRALDAALGAYPSGSAHPSGDDDPGEMSDDDEEGTEPLASFVKELTALVRAGADSEEAVAALSAKHFGPPAKDVGGTEGTGGPAPFPGKPNAGGTMTTQATDKALTLAIDALPRGNPIRAALKRQRKELRSRAAPEISMDQVFQRFPHARSLKMAMDASPGGFIAKQNARRLERMRQALIDEARETAADPGGMATDSAGNAAFAALFPHAARIKILG